MHAAARTTRHSPAAPAAPTARPARAPAAAAPAAAAAPLAAAPAPRRAPPRRDVRVAARRPRDPVIAPVIQLGEETVDLPGFLLRNRVVFLGQRVNDAVATQVVASLLALDALDPAKEIKLYVNCAAGSSYAVVAILDTIAAISAPVSTVGFGMVGGTAVHILAAGARGRRFSMPSTRIVLQQANGGTAGSADEVNIQATELNRTMRMMTRFLSNYTGLSEERVEEESDRENFLAPAQALALGIIDGVVGAAEA
jgi:ATP-dependent Clp protease protease subunit